MYGYNAGQPMAIPVLPYCVIFCEGILGECLTLLASGSDPFDYRSEQFNVSTHHYDTACE